MGCGGFHSQAEPAQTQDRYAAMSAMIGAFPNLQICKLWRPQASADLIDDDSGIAYTGNEAIQNNMLVEWAIKELTARNGGAALAIKWLGKSRRAAHNARSMSHVRHESATLPPDESESAPNRELNVPETANRLGVDPRSVYRLIDTDPVLVAAITNLKPLRFNEQQVDAHPRSRSRNDPDPQPTQRPV
jgi:hypothetical protein